ncbi:hypothetical protein ACLOJK_034428 [Asimina triloba]
MVVDAPPEHRNLVLHLPQRSCHLTHFRRGSDLLIGVIQKIGRKETINDPSAATDRSRQAATPSSEIQAAACPFKLRQQPSTTSFIGSDHDPATCSTNQRRLPCHWTPAVRRRASMAGSGDTQHPSTTALSRSSVRLQQQHHTGPQIAPGLNNCNRPISSVFKTVRPFFSMGDQQRPINLSIADPQIGTHSRQPPSSSSIPPAVARTIGSSSGQQATSISRVAGHERSRQQLG